MGYISREVSALVKRQGFLKGATGGIAVFVAAWYLNNKRKPVLKRKPTKEMTKAELKQHLHKKRGNVDMHFLKKFWSLLKICMPGLQSREFFLLLLHTGFLVARTFASIFIARLDGAIVKTIVERQQKNFMISLFKWVLFALPATYINSMIRYLESKLSIAFRTRLVDHVYKLYMKNEVYYRCSNLDSRIANADQCLTEDASKFCYLTAHIYSSISKPILDVGLMGTQLWLLASRKLGEGSGLVPTLLGTGVIVSTAQILRWVSPPFGKMMASLAKLEGDLRYVHSRVITNSEEIAFYGGHQIEQGILDRSYVAVVKQMNDIYKQRIPYTMLEGFLMKYLWSASGLFMVALPTFQSKSVSDSVSSRTRDFVTARKLLTNTADAVERVLAAYKDINELSGYTARVEEMIEVFEDCGKGKYEKNMVEIQDEESRRIRSGKGAIVIEDTLKLENVPIVSPNGDILVKSVSFEAKHGMHLLITGPNGCGKSSLFRILGGLWPIYGGTLHKPKEMFYIPQRPYLSLGNFRDQIIYPDTINDMKAKGLTDSHLEEIMKWVHMAPVLEREGGWESMNDWQDVLSGGEKQRLGMARMFYHKPQYALLDECTSAVSIDVEGKMYQHAKDIGITLLTITHRPSLWKYHDYLIQFDGEGDLSFSQLNIDTRLSLMDEKTKLEQDLRDMPAMQSRLKELCDILGEDSELVQHN
eukprot:GFYU01005378.1.p1 GENE.GFYU01005378.1~~GFYU01005378.1.p1  ORF type:complete len:701 (+),score=242.91 GFYU01005378.1:232-2334(+)